MLSDSMCHSRIVRITDEEDSRYTMHVAYSDGSDGWIYTPLTVSGTHPWGEW